MMAIERSIFVLADNIAVAQPIDYVQGTNALPIIFHFRDYEIPDGAEARIYIVRPSGKAEYDVVTTINANSITVDVKDTMFAEIGRSYIQILIKSEEKTLVTFSYPVDVKKNNVAGELPESGNHSNFIDDYLEKIDIRIEQTDELAKKALMAASAAAESEKNAAASAQTATEKASVAAESEKNAAASTQTATEKASAAAESEKNAAASAQTAMEKASVAAESEKNATVSAQTATEKASAAAESEKNATASAQTATEKASAAAESEKNATASALNAADSATEAKSYARGGTGSRAGEDSDNAKYYKEQAERISEGLKGSLLPMGTIAFDDLPDESKAGYMYNISDEFTTTERFKEGAGRVVPAGTNVYYTSDGFWDCMAGSPVTSVRGVSETTGRRGNVVLSAEDIGALSVDGDSENNTVTFNSGDSTSPTAWTEVELLKSGEKHNSILSKISTMIKNIRYLYKMLGNADISAIGDGTATGAISELNTNLSNHKSSTSAHSWSSITNKPTSYTPSSHTHDERYYTENEITTKFYEVTSKSLTLSNGLDSAYWSSGTLYLEKLGRIVYISGQLRTSGNTASGAEISVCFPTTVGNAFAPISGLHCLNAHILGSGKTCYVIYDPSTKSFRLENQTGGSISAGTYIQFIGSYIAEL